MFRFFFEFIKRLRNLYPSVYSGGTSEGAVALKYFERWGFYASIYDLANGNHFEMQKLLEEDIHKLHVTLSIRNDTNKLTAELRKPKK